VEAVQMQEKKDFPEPPLDRKAFQEAVKASGA
jgi:hypothetical protein